MKNLFLIVLLSISSLATVAIVSSCNSPAEKVEKAKENVVEANQELEQAKLDYIREVERYKAEVAEKISANDKIIADFNAKIETLKANAKAEYKLKVAELEQKNNDLKRKIDNYQESGKEKWEAFKIEFNADMERLGEAFKNFNVDNKK